MELTAQQQRAMALAEAIINTMQNVLSAVKAIPPYKLPRIAKAARRHRALGWLRVYLAAQIGQAQTSMIMCQPIPKYPAGTEPVPSGFALVGDASAQD